MGVDVERFEGEVEEGLICSLCAKVFENPMNAICGHSFCKPCLEKSRKRRLDCPKCGAVISDKTSPASGELVDKLSKLSIRCAYYSHGCETVIPFDKLAEHNSKDCPFRTVQCENKGCGFHCPLSDLQSHMEKCEYRLVECKVCKACLPRKDMPAHQAVKRCFEQLNKRKRVASARRISQELREHRVEMMHHRHLTDQEERRIVREHYEREVLNPFQRRRAMSAGPVLMRSIQARVGSAHVVPHYSRNLKSAVLDTCRGCSNKFLVGRRPSAQRHSHAIDRVSTVKTGEDGMDPEDGQVL